MRRKRWKRLKHQHRELFQLAFAAGLLDYQEAEILYDLADESLDNDDVFEVWIEPRHDDVEPTLEEIRLARDASVFF